MSSLVGARRLLSNRCFGSIQGPASKRGRAQAHRVLLQSSTGTWRPCRASVMRVHLISPVTTTLQKLRAVSIGVNVFSVATAITGYERVFRRRCSALLLSAALRFHDRERVAEKVGG